MSQKLTLAASEACALWVRMAVACTSLGRVSSKLPLAAKGNTPWAGPCVRHLCLCPPNSLVQDEFKAQH